MNKMNIIISGEYRIQNEAKKLYIDPFHHNSPLKTKELSTVRFSLSEIVRRRTVEAVEYYRLIMHVNL